MGTSPSRTPRTRSSTNCVRCNRAMENQDKLRQVDPGGGPFVSRPPVEALEGDIVAPPEDTIPAADREATTEVERLALRVGSLNLLCAPEAGREVILPPPVSRLPHMPAWLNGVASVRGALVPVMDLAAAFEVDRADQSRQYLLISDTGDDAIGFLVDGLPVLVHLDSGKKMEGVPPHPAMLDGHVRAAYNTDGTLWFDWDITGFLQAVARSLGTPEG